MWPSPLTAPRIRRRCPGCGGIQVLYRERYYLPKECADGCWWFKEYKECTEGWSLSSLDADHYAALREDSLHGKSDQPKFKSIAHLKHMHILPWENQMRLDARLYRVIKVPVENLRAAAGLHSYTPNDEIVPGLRAIFGILAPRFRIFVDAVDPLSDLPGEALCGVEVMRFSVKDAHRPQAGLVTADPLSPRQVQMADGALASELERFGVEIDVEGIEWRMEYEVRGN